MRLVDIQLVAAGRLLAVALLAALGKGLLNVVLVLGFVSWVQYARLVRGSTLGARAQDYVLSARALGASHTRIMSRHILPNITGPLLVVATINVSTEYPGRGGAELPRRGRATLDGDLGRDVERGQASLRGGMVERGLAGPGDPGRRLRHQPAR